MSGSLLEVRDLVVRFRVPGRGLLARSRELVAVQGVSLALVAGETLGVVGESGCGKSTLARAILGLVPAAAGSIRMAGEEVTGMDARALRRYRRRAQIVFQDPLAALDPRMNIGQAIEEPLRTHHAGLPRDERRRRVAAMVEKVGLDPRQLNRYPHEFSGGQCQRIGIARALVLEPELLICDEPVSALDVSVQAQIVNLLGQLQRDLGLAMLFIAHDLSVVRHVSHRIMVMYLGRTAELAAAEDLYADPRHPYTRTLIQAVPVPDPRARLPAQPAAGELPSPLDPPSGCVFRTRCPWAIARCAEEVPVPRRVAGSMVACHRAEEPLWRGASA